MEQKCQCPTETHGHEAGKCGKLATEPDHMCKPCHDKKAHAKNRPSQAAWWKPSRWFG